MQRFLRHANFLEIASLFINYKFLMKIFEYCILWPIASRIRHLEKQVLRRCFDWIGVCLLLVLEYTNFL